MRASRSCMWSWRVAPAAGASASGWCARFERGSRERTPGCSARARGETRPAIAVDGRSCSVDAECTCSAVGIDASCSEDAEGGHMALRCLELSEWRGSSGHDGSDAALEVRSIACLSPPDQARSASDVAVDGRDAMVRSCRCRLQRTETARESLPRSHAPAHPPISSRSPHPAAARSAASVVALEPNGSDKKKGVK